MTTTGQLLAICRATVDPAARPVDRHPGHHHTHALRAATTVGEVIVKIHRAPDRHRQEVHAYRHWVPALDGHAPRLLAVHDDPPAVVLTAVVGQPLAQLDPPAEAEAERDAYRQAGVLLHRLHHAAPPRTEPDMTAWLADRGDYWLHRAKDILPARTRAGIRTQLQALGGIGPVAAVPCHLDYTPGNLIHAPDGAIAVIDFEHSRYDLAARDLVRLTWRVWTRRPDLKAAFHDGYGPLTDLDREVIDRCTFLDALTAAVRAHERASAPAQPA